jgi:hypothetical protein
MRSAFSLLAQNHNLLQHNIVAAIQPCQQASHQWWQYNARLIHVGNLAMIPEEPHVRKASFWRAPPVCSGIDCAWMWQVAIVPPSMLLVLLVVKASGLMPSARGQPAGYNIIPSRSPRHVLLVRYD